MSCFYSSTSGQLPASEFGHNHQAPGSVLMLLPVAIREAMATARRKASALVPWSAMARCGNEGLFEDRMFATYAE